MDEQKLQRIDDIDRQILALLKERCLIHSELSEKDRSFPSHPRSWFENEAAEHPLLTDSLIAIFREIDSAEYEHFRPLSVAFLGPRGTFTHQAAIKYFGRDRNWDSLDTIEDVFAAVNRKTIDFGVVPVENSTEGAVNVTFDLFQRYQVRICGEIYLPIHHCMMVAPETDPSEVTVIYSHPQVFGQCRRWLLKHFADAELKETSSTAQAAEIATTQPNAAALGSELPAELYNLKIIHRNIEDFANNTTRFLVLAHPGRELPPPSGDDKTSIMFGLADRPGVLYDALLPFKRHNVNMTMIESRPSKHQNWEYVFFVDFTGHQTDPGCTAAILELKERCQFFTILGSYPRGH
ncbi:MAG: prephenate dehydratase [Lentisphaerae bacterium]|nr:MAG: prephenate dehydratase [Lentisphaerota bacterium]